MSIQVMGVCASIMSLMIWLPQAKRTWQNRNNAKEMSAISIQTQMLLIVNNIMWIVYGTHIAGGFWIWAAAIVNIPVAVMTTYLILRSKGRVSAHLDAVLRKLNPMPHLGHLHLGHLRVATIH